MKKTWQMEDVTQIAKEAPYTFYLPSQKVLKKLAIGNNVKLMFSCDVENDKGWSAERMWVLITEIQEDQYKGTLDNDPYYIPDLKYQDELIFEAKNIMQTDIEDPEPDIVSRYSSRCYVTSQVLKECLPVGHLYREHPNQNETNYSGWTLFSGEENEDYLNDSRNWHYVSLGAVLNKNDRFIHLLNVEDYAGEYVWNESKSEYERIGT